MVFQWQWGHEPTYLCSLLSKEVCYVAAVQIHRQCLSFAVLQIFRWGSIWIKCNKMFAKLSRDPKTLQRQRHAVQSWPKYPLSNSAASLANAPSRVHLEECSQIRQVGAPFESHSQVKDVKEGQVAPVRCPYHLLQIIWSDKKPAHSIPARVKFASECTQQASQASQDIFNFNPPLTARPWSDSLSVSSAPITPVSDLPTGETHPIPLYRLVHACVPSSAMIIPIKPGSI